MVAEPCSRDGGSCVKVAQTGTEITMTTVDSAIQRIRSTADLADIRAIVERDGGVIIEGLLSPDQVARFNAEIEAPSPR